MTYFTVSGAMIKRFLAGVSLVILASNIAPVEARALKGSGSKITKMVSGKRKKSDQKNVLSSFDSESVKNKSRKIEFGDILSNLTKNQLRVKKINELVANLSGQIFNRKMSLKNTHKKPQKDNRRPSTVSTDNVFTDLNHKDSKIHQKSRAKKGDQIRNRKLEKPYSSEDKSTTRIRDVVHKDIHSTIIETDNLSKVNNARGMLSAKKNEVDRVAQKVRKPKTDKDAPQKRTKDLKSPLRNVTIPSVSQSNVGMLTKSQPLEDQDRLTASEKILEADTSNLDVLIIDQNDPMPIVNASSSSHESDDSEFEVVLKDISNPEHGDDQTTEPNDVLKHAHTQPIKTVDAVNTPMLQEANEGGLLDQIRKGIKLKKVGDPSIKSVDHKQDLSYAEELRREIDALDNQIIDVSKPLNTSSELKGNVELYSMLMSGMKSYLSSDKMDELSHITAPLKAYRVTLSYDMEDDFDGPSQYIFYFQDNKTKDDFLKTLSSMQSDEEKKDLLNERFNSPEQFNVRTLLNKKESLIQKITQEKEEKERLEEMRIKAQQKVESSDDHKDSMTQRGSTPIAHDPNASTMQKQEDQDKRASIGIKNLETKDASIHTQTQESLFDDIKNFSSKNLKKVKLAKKPAQEESPQDQIRKRRAKMRYDEDESRDEDW